MSSSAASRGGLVLGAIVVAVAVALASPYFLGRQAERTYMDYLQQLDALDHIRVEQTEYRRGWLRASAQYDIVLDGRLSLLITGLFPESPEGGEPLRVRVNDDIRHGPLAAGPALAALEGRVRVDGWLFSEFLDAGDGGLEQAYEARVGFDRVVRGSWHPALIQLTSGALLDNEGWEARYSVDHAGGAFTYDLRLGEYQGAVRIGQMRFEDPTGVLMSEGSHSDILARFGAGGLRELSVDTHEPLTTLEEGVKDAVFTTRIEDQRTRLELGFDQGGRLDSMALRYGAGRMQSETALHAVEANGMTVEMDAVRNGVHAWYGGLEVGMDALQLLSADGVAPDLGAAGVHGALRLEPMGDRGLRALIALSATDMELDLLDEPVSMEYQLSIEELRRSGYEELWRLIYQALDALDLENEQLQGLVGLAFGQAAMEMVGDRPRLRAEPMRLQIGEASGEMALMLRVQPLAVMMMGGQGLLQPGNELDLRADVAGALLEKVFRIQLRQEFDAAGLTPSKEDLEEMARQSVEEQLQPLLLQGLLIQDGDRYRMDLRLEDGQLLLNDEPADWLLHQF